MEEYDYYLDADSRYLEFKKQYAEHPDWFDFDADYFAPQSPTRINAPAWSGKSGIDIYQNLIDNYMNNK